MDTNGYRRTAVRRCLGRGLPTVACILLVACANAPVPTPKQAGPEGDTSYHAVAKEGMKHYELAMGEISTGAVPAEHSAPIYPPTLLSARLPPQEVEALLIVDTQGKVSEVRIADEGQADPQRHLFVEAVRTAAMQWVFMPLRVSQWASDANGNTHEVGSEMRPFSLYYEFHFAWKDGKPVTGVSPSVQGSR